MNQNWAPTSCRPDPILSPSTISFELHAKVVEEMDIEMCSYGQLWEVQMLRDLDLGSGQGDITIQHVKHYQLAQPCDYSIRLYGNMVI